MSGTHTRVCGNQMGARIISWHLYSDFGTRQFSNRCRRRHVLVSALCKMVHAQFYTSKVKCIMRPTRTHASESLHTHTHTQTVFELRQHYYNIFRCACAFAFAFAFCRDADRRHCARGLPCIDFPVRRFMFARFRVATQRHKGLTFCVRVRSRSILCVIVAVL